MNKIIETVRQWQCRLYNKNQCSGCKNKGTYILGCGNIFRPLDSIYPFVWLDQVHYKIKEDDKYIT